jgi:formylglycine-generating enzyme required for sulfatase activity
MQWKVVNVSLFLVICVSLTACGPSASETNALGTAVAASIFATQTAGALALAATPAPPIAGPVPPTAPPTAAPVQPTTPSAPAGLQLAGFWEGTGERPGIALRISFSIAEGSDEVGDLKITATCAGSAAPDGEFTFPGSKIEDDVFAAFGTVGQFVSSDKAEGAFDAGVRITCGQGEVPLSGEWVATKTRTQSPAGASVLPTATPAPPTPTPPIIGEMASIPAGTFQRGCDPAHAYAGACESDLPLYTVYLDAFRIDKTEVTNAQYAHCVSAGGCTEPASYSSATRSSYYDNPLYANHPVIWVNWHQASAYCAWAGKRLPTAAEWEKAARGSSDTRPFPWGDAEPSCTLANFRECIGDTNAVGSYPAGASPYGALDLIGNVGEWVSDWLRSYGSGSNQRLFSNNPLGAVSGTAKMTLGGGWSTYEGNLQDRETSLSSLFPSDENALVSQYDNAGFRCAASAGDGTGQPASLGAGAAAAETPVATALPPVQAAPPQPGKAGAAGRVLWNNQPVSGTAVNICTEYSLFSGCGGKLYSTKTDRQGAFGFKDVPPNSYYLLVHAVDLDGWFFQRPARAFYSAAPITYSLTAGQTLIFDDVQIWKHDLQGGSAKPGEKPDQKTATLTWKAYPGAAYYGVYIGEQALGEPIGERVNDNSVTVTGPPVSEWWRIEAFNGQGVKIAQSRYLDFKALRSPASSGGAARPAATRPRALPAVPAAPTPGPSGANGAQAGTAVPFQVIACPTQGVAITAITVASPGWWNIRGSADIPDLEYWKGEISADGKGWTVLKRSTSPLRDGVLVEFNTSTVAPGAYQLRLMAVDRTGNYPEPCVIQVSIG